MRRRVAAVAASVVLVLGPAACGSDPAGTAGDGVLDQSDVRPLPPNDPTTLASIYDPLVEPFGLRVTRAALIDRAEGGYEVSDTGRHLALYVEPTGDYSTDDYLAGVWDVAAVVTPDVFARYTDLDSYDLCQEPRPIDDDRPEPPPVSQIDVGREAAAGIDWEGGSLVDLVRASARGELVLRVDETLSATTGWQAAVAAATAAAEPPPSSTTPAPSSTTTAPSIPTGGSPASSPPTS